MHWEMPADIQGKRNLLVEHAGGAPSAALLVQTQLHRCTPGLTDSQVAEASQLSRELPQRSAGVPHHRPQLGGIDWVPQLDSSVVQLRPRRCQRPSGIGSSAQRQQPLSRVEGDSRCLAKSITAAVICGRPAHARNAIHTPPLSEPTCAGAPSRTRRQKPRKQRGSLSGASPDVLTPHG